MPPVLTIREMKRAEAGRAADAVRLGGWGDRTAFFEFASRTPACSLFLIEAAGEIVATGIGTANGQIGWIGMIWTAPAHRGRGLGRAMTKRVIDDLAARGCPTLLLDASDAGRPIYERLGFEPIGRDLRFASAASDAWSSPVAASAGTRARPFHPRDLDAASSLDRLATGEDRLHLLEAAATDGLAVDAPDGRLAGFLLVAPLGGPAIVASDAATALALIRTRASTAGPGEDIQVALPEANAEAVARLRADGWAERSGPLRMVLGPVPAWRPAWIWGVLTFATG